MARPRWQRLTITAVKSAVALVVLWAVGRHVIRTWHDLRASSRSLAFRAGLAGRGRISLPGGAGRLAAGFTNGFCDPVRRRSG